jgi:hypothetical protein
MSPHFKSQRFTHPTVAYIGAVTGTVGMITGIIGSVMGIKAYRRAGREKARDLRIQLHTRIRELTVELDQMPKTVKRVLHIRQNERWPAVAFSHDPTQENEGEIANNPDLARIATWRAKLDQIDSLDDPDDGFELERRLIEAQETRTELTLIQSTYRKAMADLDATRERNLGRPGQLP